MLHWYRLIKGTILVQPMGQNVNPRLIAGNEPDASLDAEGGGTMFVLGLLESLPLGTGVFVGQAFDVYAYSVYGCIGGLFGTILVCWLLRNKVPMGPIHASRRGSEEG